MPDRLESRNRLRFGNFNLFNCSGCPRKAYIDVDVHVIDPARKFALFMPGDQYAAPNATEHPVWHPPGVHVQHRIVQGMTELMEKAAIFDSSLDDVVIECLKYARAIRLEQTGEIEPGTLTPRCMGIDETPGSARLIFQWFDAGGARRRLDFDSLENYLCLAHRWSTQLPDFTRTANQWLRVDRDYIVENFDGRP